MIFLPITTTLTTPSFSQKSIVLPLLLRPQRHDYDKKSSYFFTPTLLSIRNCHKNKATTQLS